MIAILGYNCMCHAGAGGSETREMEGTMCKETLTQHVVSESVP